VIDGSKVGQARICAIYARVSTDHQRAQGTIQSQVDELRELAGARELAVGAELVFCDEGIFGATLVRPALERLRDGAADGSFEVLLCHLPDRLARCCAYQVLLLDELARAGVEVIFVFEDERTETPECELLRQMQGMIVEYERAQIAERTRRGRLHRAPVGVAGGSRPRTIRLPVRAPIRARRRVLSGRRGEGGRGARGLPPLRT
jgi:site-specific DNA recombinase